MLETPQQDKLRRQLLNACEQSCIMMIMGGNKMYKTEFDLKAIMYPTYDTPLSCAIGIDITSRIWHTRSTKNSTFDSWKGLYFK